MMGVRTVGPGYPAHVLGSERFPELLGVPELRRHFGWSDELVARGTLAAGTLAFSVVLGEVRAATAVVLPCSPRSHPCSLQVLSDPDSVYGPRMIQNSGFDLQGLPVLPGGTE